MILLKKGKVKIYIKTVKVQTVRAGQCRGLLAVAGRFAAEVLMPLPTQTTAPQPSADILAAKLPGTRQADRRAPLGSTPAPTWELRSAPGRAHDRHAATRESSHLRRRRATTN